MAKPSYPKPLSEDVLRSLVLGTFGQARWTQDSPIVPDVWIEYIKMAETAARNSAGAAQPASNPSELLPPPKPVDLLVTPWTGSSAGQIARHIRTGLTSPELPRHDPATAQVAPSSSRVAARLDFFALLHIVIPLTGWWRGLTADEVKIATDDVTMSIRRGGPQLEFLRFVALAGFITAMYRASTPARVRELNAIATRIGTDPAHGHRPLENIEASLKAGLADLIQHYFAFKPPGLRTEPQIGDRIWLVNLNRQSSRTMFDARKTVKADAAQRVFDTDGKGIVFAIMDNGVDAGHVGFVDRDNPDVMARLKDGPPLQTADLGWSSRVKATYDFSALRALLSDAANLPSDNSPAGVPATPTDSLRKAMLKLKACADEGLGLDWFIAAPLIRISHDDKYAPPNDDHGTHVAGILGAYFEDSDFDRPLIGVCPKITIYDLRVFAPDGSGDEFSILAALEFVGWLNRDRDNPVVHGVNLSLALRHDVDSFGCGKTPICDACNQLVGSGVVVVAAAGNTGFEGVSKQSLGNGYRTVSITDPGNADDVITVGSTHRRDPHAYGVSYFSSRGPTGDGRRKPDILAPGEKITSTIRDNRSQRLDGTSMAAPHVSGAAALLMARYPELIGRPKMIKKILMDTATDLGREPAFQGAGLLDILRALQAV